MIQRVINFALLYFFVESEVTSDGKIKEAAEKVEEDLPTKVGK